MPAIENMAAKLRWRGINLCYRHFEKFKFESEPADSKLKWSSKRSCKIRGKGGNDRVGKKQSLSKFIAKEFVLELKNLRS